jgi:hypothetical protein
LRLLPLDRGGVLRLFLAVERGRVRRFFFLRLLPVERPFFLPVERGGVRRFLLSWALMRRRNWASVPVAAIPKRLARRCNFCNFVNAIYLIQKKVR